MSLRQSERLIALSFLSLIGVLGWNAVRVQECSNEREDSSFLVYHIIYPSESLSCDISPPQIEVRSRPRALYLSLLKNLRVDNERVDVTEINFHESVKHKSGIVVLPALEKKKSIIIYLHEVSDSSAKKIARLDVPLHWTYRDLRLFCAEQNKKEIFESLSKRKKKLSYCEIIEIKEKKSTRK